MGTNALQKLVLLEGSYDELIKRALLFLKTISSEAASEDSVVIIRVSDIDNALKRYLDGILSENQIQEWADLLEMCEYVDYESLKEKKIADALFCLSTPAINGDLNQASVLKLRNELNGS